VQDAMIDAGIRHPEVEQRGDQVEPAIAVML
jgi:hypothetical protein